MARRGTIITPQSGAAGYEVTRWYPWQHHITAIGAASTLLSGGVSSGTTPKTLATALGEASNLWSVSGLFLTTADTVANIVPDLEDVALTSPIYFDPYFYTLTGMTAADRVAVTGVYHQENPLIGQGAANAWGRDTAVAMSGSASYSIIAGDIVRIKCAPGLSIAASSISANTAVLTYQLTFTLTTASANEFAFMGLKMRYTKR